MANQVIVTNTGNVQVALTPPPNVQVQISRAAIGTVSNVPTANFANYAANVTASNQPNITSLGTLGNLSVSGTVTSGNVSTPTVYSQGMQMQGYDYVQMQYSNSVALPVSPYDIGVGSWFYLDPGGAVWQSNTTGTLKTVILGNDGTINANGNVSAPYFIGNGSQLTGIVANSVANANYANFAGQAFNVNAANITGTVANSNYAAYAGQANTANLATFATTANAVAGANVSGTVANANYSSYANIAASANSVAVANVAGIGNIAVVNLDGNVANLLTGNGTFVAIPTVSANANYANFAGQVVDNTQSNITALGTLANLSVTGNIDTQNNVTALKYYAATGGDEFSGYGFVGASNSNTAMCMTATDEITFYNNAIETLSLYANNNAKFYANVSANYYFGDGSQLSNINGANVSNVANANFASYSNIASTANSVAVANVSGIGNIATTNYDGNGSNVLYGNGGFYALPIISNVANANYANFAGTAYSVSGANVSGEVANANFASYANLASTANLATYASTANAVAGANVSGVVANANYSAFANIAATANSVAVANVSGIGNIAVLNLDGSSSNVLFGNGVFAPESTSIANANYANFAGTVITNAQPNITSTGNLVSLNINNGVAGSTTKQFQPNGVVIGSTANTNLMSNSSFVDIDYGNGQADGNVLLGKTSTYLKARGNASSLVAANVSDRVGRTNYMFYNGNANVLAAATQVNPGAGVTFNTNANAITTAGQYAVITGNPSGDQGNANALSNQNLYTFDPFGRIQITQGAAGSTSVALLINTYGGAGGNAAAGAQSIFFQRARGNRDGNLSVQPNDQLGGLNFAGHNGTGYFSTRTAGITAIVDSTYVANTANIPAGLRFQTTDNTTTYTTTFSANGSASFPGSLSTANGVTVVMNNINTVSSSFAFSTYNNANSLVNPYTFFRARGNSTTPAAAQVNDVVSSVSYNIYADAGNTFKSVSSTTVTVSDNDGAGNVASTYNVTAKTITLTGNVSANNVSINSNGFVKLASYTAANLTAITGAVGWMAAVTNSGGGGNPNGMIAFWDTTNTRWSYIHDNSAV